MTEHICRPCRLGEASNKGAAISKVGIDEVLNHTCAFTRGNVQSNKLNNSRCTDEFGVYAQASATFARFR